MARSCRAATLSRTSLSSSTGGGSGSTSFASAGRQSAPKSSGSSFFMQVSRKGGAAGTAAPVLLVSGGRARRAGIVKDERDRCREHQELRGDALHGRVDAEQLDARQRYRIQRQLA